MNVLSQGSSSTGRGGSRIYVLDTPGFFAGLPLKAPGVYYTTLGVVEEVRDEESRRVLENSMAAGRLVVAKPSGESVERVKAKAVEIGESISLSATDLEVAALAWELSLRNRDVVVFTDDYALQNLLAHLGINVYSIRTRGIKRKHVYIVKCPVCGFVSRDLKLKKCPVCGSPLVKVRVREEESG